MEEATQFVEKHHYTHTTKGITSPVCFRVVNERKEIVGAAIFGTPGQLQTEQTYSEGKYVLLELRRFVLKDEVPRNGESKVLSIMFRRLQKIDLDRIISYADPNQKRTDHPDGRHTGLIYRATGFHLIKEAGNTKAIWWKGRRYPIRNLDQYRNFTSKPEEWDAIPDDEKIIYKGPKWVIKQPRYLTPLSNKLRRALQNGEAELRKEEGKLCYIKDLKPGMPYFLPKAA